MSEAAMKNSSAIKRSWDASARKSNFGNFRFYPVLIFGLVCTFGPVAFVGTVLWRLMMGLSTGTSTPPSIILLFAIAGVIFYFGVKALRLKETGAPLVGAFALGIIAAAVTFGERLGETWEEKHVLAPVLWVLTVIFVLAFVWLIEPKKTGGSARG